MNTISISRPSFSITTVTTTIASTRRSMEIHLTERKNR